MCSSGYSLISKATYSISATLLSHKAVCACVHMHVSCICVCLCACSINLSLTIRGFQCYSHPYKEQFTISEIEHDQPLSNLTHRADVHGLCWTLSVVGQEGLTHLSYCLILLFFFFLDLKQVTGDLYWLVSDLGSVAQKCV